MEKQEFIDNYIVTFLATWTANNYQSACSSGELYRLNSPPVEDANFLADKAWIKWSDIMT